MTSTHVRADVFPARVTLVAPTHGNHGADQRTLDRVRVVVTLDWVYVFQDSPQGPRAVFAERLDSYSPPPPRTRRTLSLKGPAADQARSAQATTDSGKTLTFTASSGCGCGSRLRSFDPFSTLASTRDA